MSWSDSLFNFLAKARYYASPVQNTDGAVVELQANSRGHLLVDPNGGNAFWQDTTVPNSERMVKSAPGQLFQMMWVNTGASDVYVFIFDSNFRPANGGLPVFMPFKIVAGARFALTLPRPRNFVTGIYWGASSTATTFTYAGSATLQSSAEYN